jgi:hypothetical protein
MKFTRDHEGREMLEAGWRTRRTVREFLMSIGAEYKESKRFFRSKFFVETNYDNAALIEGFKKFNKL